ncbi:MAG: glycoside hydrolase family 95 protein [Rikenellaceae bacterium]|nr:glycoside hydrolase family 95 protein [Rikenellaceae bacterium]
MKRFLMLTVLGMVLTGTVGAQQTETNMKLWYNSPAENWNEALPVGNGHLGMMIFGQVEQEHLQLNENTIYSGEPGMEFTRFDIYKTFPEVVRAAQEGAYDRVDQLVQENWLGRLHQCYQPLGHVYVTYDHGGGVPENYYRELDISNSTYTMTYTQNGATYKREYIATNPDRVMVMRITADRPGAVNFTLGYQPSHPTAAQSYEDGILILRGQAPALAQRRSDAQITGWHNQYKHPELYDRFGARYEPENVLYGDVMDGKGMFYEAQIGVAHTDGTVSQDSEGNLTVTGAQEAVVVFSAASSYNGPWKSPSREGVDASAKASGFYRQAVGKSWEALRAAHIADYKAIFDRVKLNLYSTRRQLALPTDERIIRYKQQNDPQLAALLFQYGRYLTISASREGGQPMNLQGMWNDRVIPSWNCGYTQNINIEMNYWPLEVAALSECGEPFFRMIEEMSVSGARTAQNMYRARGWVAHHNSSIWRETYPNDGAPENAPWNMAAGWFSSHLWEHFLYTGNMDFLRNTCYPIMKGATEFCLDWLMEDPQGWWVTPVGNSPENRFFVPGTDKKAALSPGPTMDMAIIKELFERMILASSLLDTDEALRAELQEKYPKLLPYRIGARGQLQEWVYDFEEVEPRHRHVSHLYGFHPGNQIIPEQSPELFNSVARTLQLRGDEATGWSMGWKVNLWARLLDGNHANIIINNLFTPITFGPHQGKGGGLYRNMLDAHAPFQIDGNMGYTAGVIEMLMQSHAGYLHLLPALSEVWNSGSIEGIRARGGFIVDIEWKNGKLSEARITSTLGGVCRLKTGRPVRVQNTVTRPAEGKNPNLFYSVPDAPAFEDYTEQAGNPHGHGTYYYLDFDTEAGKTYRIL